MKVKNSISRRNFIKGATTSFAGIMVLPRHVLGAPGQPSPNEELTKAVIGVGGMGKGHLGYPGARLLAVCDVDSKRRQAALDMVSNDVKGYHDFREVLERPDIDIVHVPTPPHWHALISIAAADAGKDIWCEKPMSRTIGEGRKVVEAVQRNERIFRLNTWFRFQSDFYGMGCKVKPIKKLVRSGMLGWPLKVTVGANTGFSWKFQWSGQKNLTPQEVPKHLDYDMWLGPAPYKPYHVHRTHGTFRGYWDYDGGGLGDMGQHYLDPVQYILGKDNTSPVEIEVDAPQQHHDAVSSFRRVVLRYADGCEVVLDGEGTDGSAYIEGPEGKLHKGFQCDITGFQEKLDSLPDPAPQVTDFGEAVRNRSKFALNEVNGHRSCTMINLAKIAIRLGRNLKYDPVNERFIGDNGANSLINQPMRGPWHV